MAANRAYLDSQPRRYVPVLVAGGAQKDRVAAHVRHVTDGLPDEPEIFLGLNLVLERVLRDRVQRDGPLGRIRAEMLPPAVRVPQDLEGLVKHDPDQVRALLAGRGQACYPGPGRDELEATVLDRVFGVGVVTQETVGSPGQVGKDRTEQRNGVPVRFLRHGGLGLLVRRLASGPPGSRQPPGSRRPTGPDPGRLGLA